MEFPNIIYEDNHLLVVNKRSGDIVQADITGDEPLVEMMKRYLKDKYNKPGNVYLGSPHRLDRPTSGIVMFARTSKALVRLNAMFRAKEIQKTYWAVSKKRPNKLSDTLIHYLLKTSGLNKSKAVSSKTEGAKYSELHYDVIASSDHYHLFEVDPKTGRHHQIRVQLSTIGCPIKGDLKYGFPRSNDNASIHLHARKIEFVHPVKKEPIQLIAPTPDDPLWNYFEKEVGSLRHT